MEKIISGDKLIAVAVRKSDWNEGLSFFSDSDWFLQAGMWWYQSDKKLDAHYHKHCPREITHTQELLFVVSGSMEAKLYSEDQEFLESIKLNQNDILILLTGGHSYRILEENTQVLEVKNGPYYGPELDRERFKE